MASYTAGVTDSPSRALDVERLREEFPRLYKTWNQMNVTERAQFRAEQAGVKA